MISARPQFDPAAPPSRASEARALIARRLAECVCAVDEVQAFLDLSSEPAARELVEVIGERALQALDSAEFEAEVRLGPDMAGLKLRRLAALRVRFNASALAQHHRASACAILTRLDRLIHADAAQIRRVR